jgi:solute carrier family 25 carnitine/acylcarnitine transporter 20/29
MLTPSSAWTVTRQIMRTHGIRGLYRGLTATILRDCGYGAYFAAVRQTNYQVIPSPLTWSDRRFANRICETQYELSCRFFSTHQHPTSPDDANDIPTGIVKHGAPSLSWAALLVSGGIAGVAGWIATFPFDVVKTRIQGTEYTSPQPSHSPTPTALRARGMFRFVQPSNVHTTQVSPQASHSPKSTALRARGISQSVPPSNIHTQVSAQLYRTTYTTVVNSYHADGIGVFYRGLAPTLIRYVPTIQIPLQRSYFTRAIPVNMMTFATFQTVVHILST